MHFELHADWLVGFALQLGRRGNDGMLDKDGVCGKKTQSAMIDG
jgi:hypothetical protein